MQIINIIKKENGIINIYYEGGKRSDHCFGKMSIGMQKRINDWINRHEMKALVMRYHSTDNDNYRVYYTDPQGAINCLVSVAVDFVFYPCTDAGEPLHMIDLDNNNQNVLFELSKGDLKIDVDVNSWLKINGRNIIKEK